MNERARHVGLSSAALAFVLVGWMFGSHAGRTQRPTPVASKSPLAIIPPGSGFVLSADLTMLRQAALGPLLAERFGHLGPSVGDLASLCGFDPLTSLDQVALTVPRAGSAANQHSGDFGVVATGRFSAAQITSCANAAIHKRGGDPVASELGDFSSVRDRGAEGGEVAARNGGPLIVSGGSYFRELLDVAEGKATKREHQDPLDARHAALRLALGPGAVVATWLLPEGWLERVAGESSARLSSLRGLKALGARLDLTQQARLSVLFECTDATSAAEVRALLDQLRAALGALPLGSTLRAALQRSNAVRDGSRIRLNLTLDEAELRAALDATFGPSGSTAASKLTAAGGRSSSDVPKIPAR